MQAEPVDVGARRGGPVSTLRLAASAPSARRAGRRRCGKLSPATNSPVDCSCLAKDRATGPVRPARHGRGLQRPQRARFLTDGIRLGQLGLAHVLDQHAWAREHLFMCLACRIARPGADLRRFVQGYVAPEHPVMREVTASIEAATGTRLADAPPGTDGCSIPAFAIALRALALAFARVATGTGLAPDHARAALRLRQAVAREPWMVWGTGRPDTLVMQRLGERVFMKVGAEGMYCAALPERGLGVAIKIDDGNNARAAEVAIAAVIEALVALDDGEREFMRGFSNVTLRNWRGIEVGALRASASLRNALGVNAAAN
ncbi:MAG: asparaginase [Burkholderiales bacterium]|nr:asparaginase [Burkholderiales bacterium]